MFLKDKEAPTAKLLGALSVTNLSMKSSRSWHRSREMTTDRAVYLRNGDKMS